MRITIETGHILHAQHPYKVYTINRLVFTLAIDYTTYCTQAVISLLHRQFLRVNVEASATCCCVLISNLFLFNSISFIITDSNAKIAILSNKSSTLLPNIGKIIKQ